MFICLLHLKLLVQSLEKGSDPKTHSAFRFDNYTPQNWNISRNRDLAPVVWFVSHCKSESGRDRYVRKLSQYIGVHVYGKCGDRDCGKDRRLRYEL